MNHRRLSTSTAHNQPHVPFSNGCGIDNRPRIGYGFHNGFRGGRRSSIDRCRHVQRVGNLPFWSFASIQSTFASKGKPSIWKDGSDPSSSILPRRRNRIEREGLPCSHAIETGRKKISPNVPVSLARRRSGTSLRCISTLKLRFLIYCTTRLSRRESYVSTRSDITFTFG